MLPVLLHNILRISHHHHVHVSQLWLTRGYIQRCPITQQVSDALILTMFAELPAEHVPGPPPLAPGVRHDA